MPETVLCVDIDRQRVRGLGRALERAGYQPLEAHDGEQAIAVVRDEEPSLVVLDVTLPKRDGFAVLEAIRGMPGAVGQTPVLLTCVGVTPQYEERANRLGAQGILGKPVPLKELLRRAEKLVGRTPATPCSDSRAYSGSIAETRLPHSLYRLHELGATGVLMVSTAKKKKAIELRGGLPIAVKSNLVTECLGHHLVRQGRLDEDVVAQSVERMHEHGGLQGEILVAMGVLTDEEVAEALRAQAEEKLFEMFGWRRGEFRFAQGRLARANPLSFQTSPANIILEGIRKRTHSDDIDAFVELNAARHVAPSPASRYRIEDLDLRSDERDLLRGLDGSALLGDLASDHRGLGRTLYGLLATEVLELRTTAGRIVAAVPPSSAAAPRPSEKPQAHAELEALAQSMRGRSHFEILGIGRDAGDDELARAYEALAGKTSPEHFADAPDSVRELAQELAALLSNAYDVLSDPEARSAYAELLDSKTRAKGADPRPTVRSASEERTARATLAFQSGETLLEEKRYDAALREFDAARKADPRNADYLAYYGWALHRSNPTNATVTEEALAHMRQAVKLARNQEKPYLLLGRLSKALDRNRDAERYFERATQINPDCVEAARELRLISMRKGKTRELFGKLIRR